MRQRVGMIAVAACLVAGVAACGSGSVSHAQSAESCVGPKLTLSTTDAPPGATVSADGEWFAADCYDTGQAGTPPPLRGLSVLVLQDGRSWRVATNVDAASDHYTFHVPLVLPSDLAPGAAIVRVDGFGPPAQLHIHPR